MAKLKLPYHAINWADRPFDKMDLNRELVWPGSNDEFPNGAVGVRCDDDFWIIAVVPWWWRRYSIRQIAARLWPETIGDEKVTFKPDSGDPAWPKIFDEQPLIKAFDGPNAPKITDV